MSFITDAINALSGGLLDGVTNLISKTNTTDKERLALENEAKALVANYQLKVNDQLVQYEQELTKRQANDMTSDSWLSKNIRPFILAFLIGTTVLLAYLTIFILPADKAAHVDPWIGLLTNLDLAAIGFYFGSRGAEKISVSRKL